MSASILASQQINTSIKNNCATHTAEANISKLQQRPSKHFEFLYQGSGGGIGLITKSWSDYQFDNTNMLSTLPKDWIDAYVLLDEKSLVEAFSPHKSSSRLLLVSAPSGFGKSWALEKIRRHYFERGAKTFYLDAARFSLSQLQGELKHLKRLALTTTRQDILICLDNLHANLEDSVCAITKNVEDFYQIGASICISLDPKEDHLVEALAHAIPSFRIIEQDSLSPTKLTSIAEVEELTHAIPALITSLATDSLLFYRGQSGSQNYLTMLRALYNQQLKASKYEAEAKLMRRLFLLGSGSFSDLQLERKTAERDMLYSISKTTPLFGIDILNSSFSLAGLATATYLYAFVDLLEDIADKHPEDFIFALHTLLERQDTERLRALLSACPKNPIYQDFLLDRALQLIYSGLIEPVRKCVTTLSKTADSNTLQADNYLRAKAALLELCASQTELRAHRDFDLSAERFYKAPFAEQTELARLMLLRALRNVLEGIALPPDILNIAAIDEQSKHMCVAIQAIQALLRGKCQQAEQILLPLRVDTAAMSIPSIIIYTCYILASSLSGNLLDEKEITSWQHMCSYLKRNKYTRLYKYLQLCPHILGLYMGNFDSISPLEDIRKTANFAGDRVIEIVACFAKALASLRSMSPTMSSAALSRADKLLVDISALQEIRSGTKIRKTHCAYDELVDLSCIFTQLLYWREGLKLYLADEIQDPFMQKLMQLTHHLTQGDTMSARKLLSQLQDFDLSNHLWLLHILTTDIGTISLQLKAVLPEHWKTALPASSSIQRVAKALLATNSSNLEISLKTQTDPNGSIVKSTSLGTKLHHNTPIFIQIMGGLCIFVGDKVISGADIGPRMVRQFIMELALHDGHSLLKPDIWRLFWPDLSPKRQRQRLYEICYKIKKLFSPFDIERVLIAPRDSSRVTLNMELCTVDLDIIKREVSSILKDGTDTSLAEKNIDLIDELYSGGVLDKDLIINQKNMRRLEQFRDQIASAFLLCAKQAFIEGRMTLAHNYIARSRKLCFEREDLVQFQLELYMSARCLNDARYIYTQYMQHMQSVTNSKPLAVERTYAKLVKDALEDFTMVDDRGDYMNLIEDEIE